MINNLLGINSLKDSRLKWIDMAKGLAIILVVFRHIVIGLSRAGLEIGTVYEAASTITYSFRMPLFFILSGFFLRKSIEKRKFNQFLNSKFSTLLYPYLVWTCIQISIQIYFANHLNSDRSFEDYIFILIAPREIDHFWFIYALFNISITYFLFIRIFKNKKWMIFLIAIGMYHLGHYLKINVLQDVLNFFIYAVIGDIISSFILNPSNEARISSVKFLLPLALIFIGSQWIYLNYQELNHFLYGLIALTGSLFTLSISFVLGNIRMLNWIRIIGYHSLYIYIMHVMVSAVVRVVAIKFLQIENVTILAFSCLVFACIIPIIFYNLTRNTPFQLIFTPKFSILQSKHIGQKPK